MNYTGATCRDHFTNDKIKRMRCAFQEFRSGLMDDLVCQEACGSFEVNFELSSTNLVPNTNINFSNLTNEDSIQYTWEVNSQVFNSEHLSYSFPCNGIYVVCLNGTKDSCTEKSCIDVIINGTNSCENTLTGCQKVLNSDFEENFVCEGEGVHLDADNQAFFANTICGWLP